MNHLLFYTLLFPFLFSTSPVSSTLSTEAVVHAVLFYSPICSHCNKVITEVLPPLFERYGDQLYIVSVNMTQPDGYALFLAALQYFNLESYGVPFLVIGDIYLIGSVDIPEQFPGLIDEYLSRGGVDWPDIPGLAEAIRSGQVVKTPLAMPPPLYPYVAISSSTPTPTEIGSFITPTPGLFIPDAEQTAVRDLIRRDPLGNSLAILVLVAMILSVIAAILLFKSIPGTSLAPPWAWIIPILCIVGLGVASYLTYVEMTQAEAVCGPVGDCNTVQQSEYTRLFGILPFGILGLAGYVMILLAWVIGRIASQRLAAYASLALLGLTAFGLLFSIYLTFLEPFVIGATCAWCLTSALIMTALLWLSLAPGKLAYTSLFHGEKYALERPNSQRAL